MTTALATVPDLEARMGAVSDAARARAVLQDASNLIHAETNNAWVSDGALIDDVPGIALTVCCAVARRVIENPSGVTSEALGPFSQSIASSSNDVYLTKAEKRTLRRAAGLGAGVLELESPYPLRQSTTDVYVPWVDADSEQFPMGPFPIST
jgi:hypothetical protein